MSSQIESQLTRREKIVLDMYRDAGSGLLRATLLSIGYAAGAGVFVALAIWERQPMYVLIVYGVLLTVMGLRLWRGRQLAGVMPRILNKYEATIAELRATARGRDG